MNANRFELPDSASGAGDDVTAGRALTRVRSERLSVKGEKTRNQNARASVSPEQAGEGERAESSIRESTSSEALPQTNES